MISSERRPAPFSVGRIGPIQPPLGAPLSLGPVPKNDDILARLLLLLPPLCSRVSVPFADRLSKLLYRLDGATSNDGDIAFGVDIVDEDDVKHGEPLRSSSGELLAELSRNSAGGGGNDIKLKQLILGVIIPGGGGGSSNSSQSSMSLVHSPIDSLVVHIERAQLDDGDDRSLEQPPEKQPELELALEDLTDSRSRISPHTN